MPRDPLYSRNTPTWIILVIDLGIVVFSLLLAYLLRFNFKIPQVEIDTFHYVIPFVIGVRALSFLLGKTYRGMIRFTSSKDAQRIFIVVLSGSVFMAASNMLRYYGYDQKYMVPFSIIIIEFLATMFFMITFRITTKQLYFEFKNASKDASNVIIYGAGESGIITKRTLDRVSKVRNQVVGFLDDNPKKVGKKIEGINIYHPNYLDKLLEKKEIDQLIIAFQGLGPTRKKELIEKLLAFNIKVSNVPPPTDWIHGELTYKQIQTVRIEDLLGREQIELNKEEIHKYLSNKTVLITGAAGSIGSELARQIAPYNPNKLLLLDQAESPLYDLDLELKDRYGEHFCELLLADVRNRNRIKYIFKEFRPDVVFHAAAYKHVPLMEMNPTEAVRTNIQGTKAVVDMAGEFEVGKFILVSTDKAVNPTNVMGASKRISEIYAQAANDIYKTKYITTRFGNVLGSNGSVIPLFRKQIENGGPLTVTHREITRYFMTIPEACQLVIEAGNMGKGGEIYIFDMGQPVKIYDLAKKMVKLSGLELGSDMHIQITGLRPGEKLHEELLANEENTINTHHPKIMIAKVRKCNFEEVSGKVEALIQSQRNQNYAVMVKKMKEMVPEYISNNSVYEKLDRIRADHQTKTSGSAVN